MLSNEIKHTPGPWTVEVQDEENTVTDDGDTEVFYVCHPWTTCPDTTICKVEDIDDAHLIAASPTLLSACEVALDALEDTGNYEGTRRALRYAIAKATGGGDAPC